MGWSSGNEIFDPVCEEVIRQVKTHTGMYPDDAERLLTILIDSLQDADWDTEDESLHRFRMFKYVVNAFANNHVTLNPDIEDANLEGDLL